MVIYFANGDLDQFKDVTQGSYNRQKLQGRLNLVLTEAEKRNNPLSIR